MKIICSLALLATTVSAAEPLCLENAYVRAVVDPQQGGAVTNIFYKKALTFSFIADKGAGIAGCGSLFAPMVSVGGVAADLSGARVVASKPHAISILATGALPGLAWERRLWLGEEESGFTIEDVLRNDSDHAIAVEIGAVSQQQAVSWRLTDRSWIGTGTDSLELPVASTGAMPAGKQVRGSQLFWRQIEQYGTGFTYRLGSLPVGGAMTAEVLPQKGHPVRVAWRSGVVAVPARGSVAIKASISVDEGGGAPDERNAFAPVLVRSDFTAAGRSGHPLIGYATAVSDEPRRVRIAVWTDRELTHQDLALVPGKVARIPASFVPSSTGPVSLRVVVTEHGEQVGSAAAQTVIDGDSASAAWRAYDAKMPERYYHGTWEQIGGQLAGGGRHGRDKTGIVVGPGELKIKVEAGTSPDNGLGYYQKNFPYFAELLSGVARAVGASPSRVFLTSPKDKETVACMDVAFYGPDGPINAFSKERTGTSFHGLDYTKVIPAKGYPFHVYMGSCGINAEGLSISSATLNEDEATDAIDLKAVVDEERAGRFALPPRMGFWMLLAMCRTVDEAVAEMQKPGAPFAFTSDVLMLDRAGHAARIQSVGFDHQVFRHGPGEAGFCVSGNYPVERSDGRFKIGPRWGWAANTMLREHFLQEYAGPRQGSLGLQDVFALMQTHEAGGMCQHLYDNPGQLYTSCSFIAVTKTGDLWLTQGPPCEMQYVRHTLTP